jgi:1-acyl-sn-glycerol-3-phosphate acyltransferase
MDRIAAVLSPLARLTQPRFVGLERVPPRRSLFVGNHTIFGLIDVPFMISGLWKERGIVLRGLGDHGHYAVPGWRNLLEMSGMVRGTRDNVRALMGEEENILVFPGGSGEVFKSRGEKYRLKWRERLGFVRLALELDYRIVPFAAIGVEDMFDIVADSRTPGLAQLSELTERLLGIPLPPIPRGIGPTPLARPERLYFWFGPAIETSGLGQPDDDRAARQLRDRVRAEVERGIDDLLAIRESDPRRGVLPRLLGNADETPDSGG